MVLNRTAMGTLIYSNEKETYYLFQFYVFNYHELINNCVVLTNLYKQPTSGDNRKKNSTFHYSVTCRTAFSNKKFK